MIMKAYEDLGLVCSHTNKLISFLLSCHSQYYPVQPDNKLIMMKEGTIAIVSHVRVLLGSMLPTKAYLPMSG